MMKEENEPEAEKPTYKEDRSRSLADENDDKIIKIEADMESELEIPTSYEDGSRSPSGENVNISIKTENNIESNVAMTISKEEQLKRSIKAILGENLEENIDEGKVNIFVTVNVNGSTDEGPNIVQEPQGQDKQLTQRQNKKRTRRSSKSHLQCTFCGKVMSSEYRLQCHVGKHTGAAAGTCKFCDKNFSDIGSLKRHYKTCQRDKNFPCKLCGFVFISQKILDRHMTRHSLGIKKEYNEEAMNCDSNEIVLSDQNSKPHKITELSEDVESPDDNPIDDPMSYQEIYPRDDPLLPDPLEKPKLKCRYCGKVISNPRSLKYHETGHTRDNPITCVVCDKVFYHPQTARNHISNCEKKIHLGLGRQDKDKKDSEVKPKPELICKFCGKVLLNIKSLKFHENKHTGENPINCPICDKVFYHPKTARDHIKKCEEITHLSSEAQDSIKQEIEDWEVKMVTHDDWDTENLLFGEESSNGDHKVTGAKRSSAPRKVSRIKQESKTHSKKKSLCKVCGKNVWDLARHIRIHTGEKPYQCSECGESFRLRCNLNRHYSSVHTDVRLKCSFCEKEFNRKWDLTSHMRIHTEKDHPFQCDLCGNFLSSERALKVHKKNHGGNKKYLCMICGQGFTRSDSYNTHRVTKHKIAKPFSCERCGKGFLMMCFLTKHQRLCDGTGVAKVKRGKRANTISSDQKYKCDFCSKLVSAANMRNHVKIHTGEKPYVCSVCGKAFTFLRSLKYHSMEHSGERPYKCDQCEKAFKTSNHLTLHMRSHTGEKPYKCEICGKGFNQSVNLSKHIKMHHDRQSNECEDWDTGKSESFKFDTSAQTVEKPFVCGICGKAFAQNAGLKYHTMNHTGERPFKCDQCEKAFKLSDQLKAHMIIHTGEKPFKCDICGRGFNNSENRARHKKIHDDKRPFECKTCGMTFKFAVILKRHEMRHTGEKPFKCSVCERAFSDSRPLKKHMLIHSEIN